MPGLRREYPPPPCRCPATDALLPGPRAYVQITAMQIAALKRLNKGTTLYILDRNGSGAKAVAKELAKRGFGKAFVVAGGFQAWTSAKLATKLSSSVGGGG